MLSISTQNLTRIRSFEAAQKHWNSQKEWKTEHTSWRPLDNRRAKHKRLVKLSDDCGYECVLYQTAMVTYLSDGDVLLNCYNSTSSNVFAWYVAPRGCSPTSNRGFMYWEVGTDEGTRFYRSTDKPLRVRPTAAGNWELVSEAAQDHEWAYDRKQGAAVQKVLKNYQIWHDTTARLGRAPTTRRYFNGVDQRRAVEQLMLNPDNVDIYPTVANDAGDPSAVREVAYEHTGARYKVPVPYDRLPRKRA